MDDFDEIYDEIDEATSDESYIGDDERMDTDRELTATLHRLTQILTESDDGEAQIVLVIDRLIDFIRNNEKLQMEKVLPSFIERKYEKEIEEVKAGLAVCNKGLERYPNNLDFLTRALRCATLMEDNDVAAEYYTKIKQVSYNRWNDLTYETVLNFLFMNPESNEKEILQTLQEGKKWLDTDEIYVKEYQFYNLIGDRIKGMESLKQAMGKLENAVKSALILINLQFSKGLCSDVIKTGEYLRATTIINDRDLAYVNYMITIARDSLFQAKLKNASKKADDFEDEFLRLDDMYDELLKNFSCKIKAEDIEKIKIKKNSLQYCRTELGI